MLLEQVSPVLSLVDILEIIMLEAILGNFLLRFWEKHSTLVLKQPYKKLKKKVYQILFWM